MGEKMKCINLKHETIPDHKFVKSQLVRGMKVEFEHTNLHKKAKAIAKAHLLETGHKTKSGKISSKYYDELYKLERKLKRRR
jgi:hypothetical protein